MLTKTTLLLSIFIGVMLAVPASIWAVSQTATLAPGDTLTVSCGTRLTGCQADTAQYFSSPRNGHLRAAGHLIRGLAVDSLRKRPVHAGRFDNYKVSLVDHFTRLDSSTVPPSRRARRLP